MTSQVAAINPQRVADLATTIEVYARLHGESLAKLATAYGCSRSMVTMVAQGKRTSLPLLRFIEKRYHLTKGSLAR